MFFFLHFAEKQIYKITPAAFSTLDLPTKIQNENSMGKTTNRKRKKSGIAVVAVETHMQTGKKRHDSEAWLSFSFCWVFFLYTCAISFYIIFYFIRVLKWMLLFQLFEAPVPEHSAIAVGIFFFHFSVSHCRPSDQTTHTQTHKPIFVRNMQFKLTHFCR